MNVEERERWRHAGGRRTRETPDHRCWACDNRARILAAKPGSLLARYQADPYLGCEYARRMARKAGR